MGRKLLFGLPGLLLVTSIGQSATVTFSGSGTTGTMSPGVPWLLVANDSSLGGSGISVWGTPGLAQDETTWPAADGVLSSLTITFTGLPAGVSINEAADPGGYNDSTRFQSNGGVDWTETFTGTNTVTFTAPAGQSVPAGGSFFVNIGFVGGTVSTVNFTGAFNGTAAPEPATLSMTGLALMGLAFAGSRKWKRAGQ